MDQVHVIRHAVLKQGRSRRSVALELGVSRNTVRKYLEESEPRFSAPVGRRQPVLERVKARLDELLAEWSARTTAKQRITGSRLHGQLRMEGFDVGITLQTRWICVVSHASRCARRDLWSGSACHRLCRK